MSRCEKCNLPLEIGMFPFCKGNPADHGEALRHHPFKSFEIEVGGEIRRIDSLQAATAIESETMTRFKRGEKGIAPLVFRAFHYDQDGKHYDSNAFGSGPAKHPSEFLYNQRAGKITVGEADMKD